MRVDARSCATDQALLLIPGWLESRMISTVRCVAALAASVLVCLGAQPVGADEPPAGGGTPAPAVPVAPGTLESLRLRPDNKTEEERMIARGRKFAVIVGVGEATVLRQVQTPLIACRLDAAAMRAALSKMGYDCRTLVDVAGQTAPTVDEVATALTEVTQAAGPNDQVLVYMSSHGGQAKGKAFVVLKDGTLPLETIKSLMGKSRALVRVLMMDCCRDDKGFSLETAEVRDVHVISACRPDELSQVGPNGLSIFTEVFVDGVTDCAADRVADGIIELDEIVRYIDREVPKRAKRYWNEQQHPTRTVVDAKMINPIVGACEPSEASPNQPVAFAGPKVRAARQDWKLTSLMILKVREGMTREQVREAMGREADEGEKIDPQGNGVVFYDNEPKPGDAMMVEYAAGKVAHVSVLPKKLCDGEFDAAVSRQSTLKLLGGAPISELTAKLKGKTMPEVIKAIGCPAAALIASDGQGGGQLRYVDVPRITQMLVVVMEGGKVSSVDVVVLEGK